MIAKPLEWVTTFSMVYADCMHGSYEWNPSTRCMYYTHINAINTTIGVAEQDVESELLGIFANVEDAKAASERHHQVSYVRGMAQWARNVLRSEFYSEPSLSDESRETVEAILTEAEAADRAEQSAKAGAT